MKKLLLLRHAKSSWEDTTLPDFERPLNERGRRAAPLIGEFMRERQLRPELVICSPAKRTRETIALVLAASRLETETRYDERIYEATLPRLLEVVSQIADDRTEVLLVGHNPGFENLLERLTGESERMPTAALARITLDADKWTEAAAKGGRLEWLVTAKELAKR
jgi:phosphohistidine phosphatase